MKARSRSSTAFRRRQAMRDFSRKYKLHEIPEAEIQKIRDEVADTDPVRAARLRELARLKKLPPNVLDLMKRAWM